MKKRVVVLSLMIYLFGMVTSMQALSATNWKSLLEQTWRQYKANYIFCGANCGNNLGLVFDPLSGYHAVSEGVGYGMLLSVMLDDQPTFDTIYDAAHQVMYDPSTGLHHWQADNKGNIIGYGSATDAEQDIALALIFAQLKVGRQEWTQHASRPYGEQARLLLDAIWKYEVVDGQYLKPGDRFQGKGQDIINLSYFSPAWYRIFDQYLSSNQWQGLITAGYQALNATEGSPMGLVPDWSTFAGAPAYDYCDSFGRPRESCGYDMRYDAIRTPWRIGLDCLWFNEARACDWSKRSMDFLSNKVESQFARMYNMQGKIVVDYRDESMLSMWLMAAIASDNNELRNRLEWNLYNFAYENSSIAPWQGRQPYYYNQSLALFSISYLSGDFKNLLIVSP